MIARVADLLMIDLLLNRRYVVVTTVDVIYAILESVRVEQEAQLSLRNSCGRQQYSLIGERFSKFALTYKQNGHVIKILSLFWSGCGSG